MGSLNLIFVFAFVLWARGKQILLAENQTADEQRSMDMHVDKLADELLNRALTAWPLHDAEDIENTMVGKPGHVQIPGGTKFTPPRGALQIHRIHYAQQEQGRNEKVKLFRSHSTNGAEREEEARESRGIWRNGSPSPPMSPPPPAWQRRQLIALGTSMMSAEAGWRQAVANAATTPIGESLSMLPAGTIEQIEAGRVVEIKNWLPADELAALRADAAASFAAGYFKPDALAAHSGKKIAANDRMVMPSFYASKGIDGPWVDPTVGNNAARQRFKARMAEVKVDLARQLQDRSTLAEDGKQTHEMMYSRYGPGAFLPRHLDEHHGALKNAHSVASGDEHLKRLAAGTPEKATRRSVTWLVYLNDDWNPNTDGGELRVHERMQPSVASVGACGSDLQVGWLRATETKGEQPVFLDSRRPGNANCCLYTCDAEGSKRDLSRKPFAASPVLQLAGGDFFARKLLVDDPADAKRFHLIDSVKSAASAFLPPTSNAGEDGGERVRDITPKGGTLVLFDSVSVPHEVLATKARERYAMTGWFHEKLYS